jgi:hypothetical protein
MSQQAVEQIVGRLVTDEKFRKLFFSNPEEALKGYDLTPEERKALLKIKAEDVEGFSGKLDKRITKGKMIL